MAAWSILFAWYFSVTAGPDAPKVVGPYAVQADCESARRFAEIQLWRPPQLVAENPRTWVQMPPPKLDPCYFVREGRRPVGR
jgi:hypothetical protein